MARPSLLLCALLGALLVSQAEASLLDTMKDAWGTVWDAVTGLAQ